MTKRRIWELDALRGLLVLGMVAVHLVYDLSSVFPMALAKNAVFLWVKNYGGLLFLLLSGLCVTLGSHALRRGAIVLGCGMVCSLVTYGMYRFGMLSYFTVIRFGVLHCLGACMLLWPTLKRLPIWLVALLGAAVIGLGYWFDSFYITTTWLYPLGLKTAFFSSGDYFPLAPSFGWFLLGACLGRLLYKQKVSLLPKVNENLLPLRLLRFCGRHALLIYLLHQPIITGLLMVL